MRLPPSWRAADFISAFTVFFWILVPAGFTVLTLQALSSPVTQQKARTMKAPTNIIPALNIDAIRNGDPNAVADAIQNLWTAHNTQAVALGQRIGGWKDVAYDAAYFTSGAPGLGSWVVPANAVLRYRYIVIDNVMILKVFILNAKLPNATTSELRVAVPGGYVAVGDIFGGTVWSGGDGKADTGALSVGGDGTYLIAGRANGTDLFASQVYPQSATGGTAFDVMLGFVAVLEILPPAGN